MYNQEIRKENYEIGVFMGRGFVCSHITDYTWENAPKMLYHSKWEWLMPVIVKIEKIENGRFGFTVDPWSIEIIDYCDNEKEIVNLHRERDSTLMNDYFDAINIFLEWYKTNKK